MVREYCPSVSQHVALPGALARVRLRYLAPIAALQATANVLCRLPGVLGSNLADLTWIERSFLPGMEPAVVATGSPRVLDVDDAMWMQNPLGAESAARLARRMDAVIAGNQFLAAWYSAHCKQVYVVPTAIDCERFKPREKPSGTPGSGGRPLTVGWTGSAGNLLYLEAIERELERFLARRPDARLLVVCDRAPRFGLIPPGRVHFSAWSVATEASAIGEMDIGIMPLPDTDWARGKCSFKMLQYMAAGIPAVVSLVGMNTDILAAHGCGIGIPGSDDWADALDSLYVDESLRLRLGSAGRAAAVAHYSTEVVSPRLADTFRDIAR